MLKVNIFRLVVRMMPVIFWRKKHLPKDITIFDRSIPTRAGGVRLRIYTPTTPSATGKYPVTMYMHGGGWVVGSVASCDPICQELASKANHVVVSVDYPLSPENPFPAAPHACLDTLEWIANNSDAINADTNNIFVGGDSAGGNLATVTALQTKISHPNLIKGQILLYPVTDHYSHVTQSYRDNLKTKSLNKDTMTWFWDNYLNGNTLLKEGEVFHPMTTPLTQEDVSGLPPALVLIADIDPLRDEGLAYAEKLIAQGNDVQHTLYPDVEHGFIGYMGPTDAHNKAMNEIVDWLAQHQH